MTKKIPISGGNFALVDDRDFDLVSKYKWHIVKDNVSNPVMYAQATLRIKGTSRRANIYMHRLILGQDSSLVTDHIDHNGLNNTRKNLRACTVRDNNKNKREYGVRSQPAPASPARGQRKSKKG